MLIPLKNNVLVRPTPPPTHAGTEGLIVRPDSAWDVPAMSGTVVRVAHGPASAQRVRLATIRRCRQLVSSIYRTVPAGREWSLSVLEMAERADRALTDELSRVASVESEVSAGDLVAFSSHAGRDVTVNGERLLLLRQEDLEAVWREESDVEAAAV